MTAASKVLGLGLTGPSEALVLGLMIIRWPRFGEGGRTFSGLNLLIGVLEVLGLGLASILEGSDFDHYTIWDDPLEPYPGIFKFSLVNRIKYLKSGQNTLFFLSLTF